jgi:hypothetical protein
MSCRPKICQIVPTTFHGMSSGIASSTSTSEARQPCAGMASASATPSGTWMASTAAEKSS